MIPVTLRAYQTESIDHVRAQLRAKHRRVLLCIPTGGGKTLTAASILASAVAKGSRVLFVAHRKELIDQTVTTFARLGITSIGVIRAQDPRRDPKAPIQIAMEEGKAVAQFKVGDSRCVLKNDQIRCTPVSK